MMKRSGLPVRSSPLSWGGEGRGEALPGSELAELTVEFAVVQAVHSTVSVEVEVPEIMGVTGNRFEGGPEEITVQLVHIAVAVTVAEEPEEALHGVPSRNAVAVPVQLPPPAVV